jgi:hypothetical protein
MTRIDPFEIPFIVAAAERRVAGDMIGAEKIIAILNARRKLGKSDKSSEHSAVELETKDEASETIEHLQAFNLAGIEIYDNALFAWGEIFLLPQDAPLPAWVRQYLREVAIEFFYLAGDKTLTATNAARKVPAALRIVKAEPDKWNAFADIRACRNKLMAAVKVMNLSGKREYAVEEVAEALKKSPRAIFRWLKDAAAHHRRATDLRLSRDREGK